MAKQFRPVEKRALKRQRQRAAGYKRESTKGVSAQMTHASSGRDKKKAAEGERRFSPGEAIG